MIHVLESRLTDQLARLRDRFDDVSETLGQDREHSTEDIAQEIASAARASGWNPQDETLGSWARRVGQYWTQSRTAQRSEHDPAEMAITP